MLAVVFIKIIDISLILIPAFHIRDTKALLKYILNVSFEHLLKIVKKKVLCVNMKSD